MIEHVLSFCVGEGCIHHEDIFIFVIGNNCVHVMTLFSQLLKLNTKGYNTKYAKDVFSNDT